MTLSGVFEQQSIKKKKGKRKAKKKVKRNRKKMKNCIRISKLAKK